MHITYDPESDVLSIELRDLTANTPTNTDQVAPGIILLRNPAGDVLGMEVLDASKRVDGEPTQVLIEVLAPEPARA